MNPNLNVQEDLNYFFQHELTREKLQQIANGRRLEDLEKLEVALDSRKTGQSSFGKLLPNLKELKLNNSFVPLVRDLGTGFSNLVILWMSRCNLKDLGGITTFRVLRELYLSFNDIEDIEPLSQLDFLEILDLESNKIGEIEQLEYLGLCPRLQQLTLQGNPLNFDFEETEESQVKARTQILDIIPHLKTLDDLPVIREAETMPFKPSSAASERPMTSYGRRAPSPLNQLLSDMKLNRPGTSDGYRPQSSHGRVIDYTSDLTVGFDKPITGSIVSVLRSKRKTKAEIFSFEDPSRTNVEIDLLEKESISTQ